MTKIITSPKFHIDDVVGLINSNDKHHYKIVESRYNNPVYQNKWSYICHRENESKGNIHIFEEKQLGLVKTVEEQKQTSNNIEMKASGFRTSVKNVEYPDHQLHLDLIMKMHETYKIKNIDYGSSFSEQYQEHGILSSIIRFDDKIRRIKQLMRRGKAEVNDESLKDTVKDLANYAVMLWMELEKEEKNKSV